MKLKTHSPAVTFPSLQARSIKPKAALFFATVALFLASVTTLTARTWTEAKTGRTLEGNFVESDGGQVTIKSSDRTFKIDIARLSEADQAFIKEQAAGVGGRSDSNSLAKLTPPALLKVAPITGKGDDRKSKIEFTNEGDKEVTGFILDTLYLTADGSVGKTVPHTQSGSNLKKGKSHNIDVTSFFMEEDTTSIDARIAEITYDDDSTWPPAPETPPARSGEDLAAAMVIGIIGEGDRSEPVTALHNYGKNHIKRISYQIEYLDETGKVVDKTSYGYGGEDPILSSGKTIVLSGGDGPPEGAVNANANVTRITFADDSQWEAPR